MQELKKALRSELIRRRKEMDKAYRKNLDERIYNNLKGIEGIFDFDAYLIYASSPIEVDTRAFTRLLLSKGKAVAVPKCEGKNMRFLLISSLSELIRSKFGVDEPIDGEEITDFRNTLCITPSLSFNEKGYRLGYGGGFYDRFFEKYDGIKLGICYEEFCGMIPTDGYDIPVDTVVTEKGFFCGKEDFCGRKRIQ